MSVIQREQNFLFLTVCNNISGEDSRQTNSTDPDQNYPELVSTVCFSSKHKDLKTKLLVKKRKMFEVLEHFLCFHKLTNVAIRGR